MIFIDINKIPEPECEYVAWVDIMGTIHRFDKNTKAPSIFILKLHSALRSIYQNFQLKYENVPYYPVMDGFFLTSKTYEDIEFILCKLYLLMATEFLDELQRNGFPYTFMIRGSISYGMVIHGATIPPEILPTNVNTSNLLFGKAIVDAFRYEKKACPFGIIQHDSALKTFENEQYPIYQKLHDPEYITWFFENDFDAVYFQEQVNNFYAWYLRNNHFYSYPDPPKDQRNFNDVMDTYINEID